MELIRILYVKSIAENLKGATQYTEFTLPQKAFLIRVVPRTHSEKCYNAEWMNKINFECIH